MFVVDVIKNIFERIRNYFRETRHYNTDFLTHGRSYVGYWNTIDISNCKELINLLWKNHISKISHIDYYLSEDCIECVVKTPRGYNSLKWKMFGEEPFFIEYGVYNSGTRYDINYPMNLECCSEMKEWFIKTGTRLNGLYIKDKNL